MNSPIGLINKLKNNIDTLSIEPSIMSIIIKTFSTTVVPFFTLSLLLINPNLISLSPAFLQGIGIAALLFIAGSVWTNIDYCNENLIRIDYNRNKTILIENCKSIFKKLSRVEELNSSTSPLSASKIDEFQSSMIALTDDEALDLRETKTLLLRLKLSLEEINRLVVSQRPPFSLIEQPGVTHKSSPTFNITLFRRQNKELSFEGDDEKNTPARQHKAQ